MKTNRKHRPLAVWIVLALASGLAAPVMAAPASVDVVNASHPTRCAEEDNVYVKLYGRGLRALRIEARHPAYMKSIAQDQYEADFTGCNFDEASHPTDTRFPFQPKQVILWETDRWRMVGNTHESFWRANAPDFVVEGRVTREIHLMQLYLKDPGEPQLGRHQFLVLYPPDGYWRAKPIPTLPLNYGVYGTSFLVGPVDDPKGATGRPVVDIARVEFVPASMTFKLDYKDGSKGTLKVDTVDRERIGLDYTHDRALPGDRPLAAIRSMYVAPDNADAAEVVWRPRHDGHLGTRDLMRFKRAPASEVRFGRSVPSRHNTSAPDTWFGRFER